MPTTLLSELHYLPSIAVFSYYKQADIIRLEAGENYQKGSYRNRCHIVAANGPQRLSIPLAKGKNNQQNIQAVAIVYHQAWHKQHWQSIRSAYGNAPYFEYYADQLQDHFLTKQYDLLWDFNFALLKTIFQLLQWEKTVEVSNSFEERLPIDVVDLRNKILPLAADEPKLGMHFPPYPQVFSERHGFMPNLSILDLLFCLGPQANLYLASVSTS